MEIFQQPKVYLIAEPQINWDAVQSFLEDTKYNEWKVEDHLVEADAEDSGVMDPDLLGEFCGRMCYCSFGNKQGRKENRVYLKNIIESGHGSILEHANFTFLVTQCSRGFTHEMVRHRAGFAYSQESTHYIDYNAKTGKLCLDFRLCKVEELKKLMEQQAETALMAYEAIYKNLRLADIKKKDACSISRQILPIGIEAKLAFTGNLRSLRHFCTVRGNAHNVLEIRRVALDVFEILKKKAPNSMQGLKVQTAEDGMPEIVAEFGRKV